MNATDGPRDFDAWFRATFRRVVESVALMAGSREIAEDVTAEAFARALERWDRVSTMASPEGWVLTVARNLLRRTMRRRELEKRLVGRFTPSPGTNRIEPPTVDDALWRAVAQLSPREREVIAWRYLMDMKEAETARQMSIADGTVARLLHDARQKLRVALVNDPSEARADG